MKLEAQLIADITALKIISQQLAGVVSLLAGKDNNFIQAMHQNAHASIEKNRIIAPGLDSDEISARTAYTIDQVLSSIRVDHADNGKA